MHNETETQARMRRAKESLAAYKDAENAARAALRLAEESTRKAKEKYEALFLANEKEECQAKLANYRHCTA